MRRKLKLVANYFILSSPKEATIIIDRTCFSRTFGVMLFQDATSGKILYRKFVKNETNKDYLSGLENIKTGGTRIKVVVLGSYRPKPLILHRCASFISYKSLEGF